MPPASCLLLLLLGSLVSLADNNGVLGQASSPEGIDTVPIMTIKNSAMPGSDVSGGNGLQLSNDQQEFTFKSNSLRLTVPGGPTFVLPPGFQLPPDIAAQLQSRQQTQVAQQVNGQGALQGPPPVSQSPIGTSVATGIPVSAGNGPGPLGVGNSGVHPMPPPIGKSPVLVPVPAGPNAFPISLTDTQPGAPPKGHFNDVSGPDDAKDFHRDDIQDAPLPPPSRLNRPTSDHRQNRKTLQDRPLKPDPKSPKQQVVLPVATFSQLGVGVYQGWGSQSFVTPPKQANRVDYFHSSDY